jgi:hypothetical protein
MKREIRARLRSLTDHIESSLVSMEKKNKAKNAKIIRAAKSQLEKLVRSLVHFFRRSISSSPTAIDTLAAIG